MVTLVSIIGDDLYLSKLAGINAITDSDPKHEHLPSPLHSAVQGAYPSPPPQFFFKVGTGRDNLQPEPV